MTELWTHDLNYKNVHNFLNSSFNWMLQNWKEKSNNVENLSQKSFQGYKKKQHLMVSTCSYKSY